MSPFCRGLFVYHGSMKTGTEHKPVWENVRRPFAPPLTPVEQIPDREHLRERFRAVIIGAGYSESAADSILAEYLEPYLKDVPNFIAMLERYERAGYDPE